MNRREFSRLMTIGGIGASTMSLVGLKKLIEEKDQEIIMPALFLGHGSPMNAIEENEFVKGFRDKGSNIHTPKAILCISAHWETKGTKVTAMEHPRTIHDFGGFPEELFQVQYPAPGSPELAKQTKELITSTKVDLDHAWGLDHGAWSVIKHMYPDANIPVIQMSIDYTKPPQYHYDLAKELAALRKKGILIIGSGNMVHNLRMVAWNKLNEKYAFDWAKVAREKMNQFILNDNHDKLIDYKNQGNEFLLSIPTPEHFLPLLYVLGLQDDKDKVSLFNDEPIAGSLTMTSVQVSQ